jgi:dipeptidyl-peptidase-4
VRRVLTEDDDKFFDESYDLTLIGSKVLWLSWRDGNTHIYEYSFDPADPLGADLKLEKQLTKGSYEVEAVKGVDEKANTIYYLSNEGDAREEQLWAIKLDGTGKHQVTSQSGVHEVVFSRNGRFFSDKASSTMVPPTLSTCRMENDCNVFWTAPSVAAYDLTGPEQLELKAADGKTTLFANLFLPSGHKDHIPLIVNPYGGPHAQTVRYSWSGRSLLFDEVLTQHGYAVLHVDNRGMGGRGRDFEQAAHRNFGPVQFEDQLAALDQVLSTHRQLDPAKLGWWGWSWGGSFTLYAMTHSDRFRAGVSVAPVTDYRDYDSIYTERYLGLPAQNEAVYREQSVVNSAKDLKGRLLLVHGTGDDNVHLENSIQFLQKLIEADKPYDLQLYPRKTHSIAGPEARTHLYERILAHFETYLPAGDDK